MNIDNTVICVVGLGYVGLPLADAFSKKYKTIGYDINKNRVAELVDGIDSLELFDDSKFIYNENLHFTSSEAAVKTANTFIVTVPTPIDVQNNPDLSDLKSASEFVGRALKVNDIVIFESTVFPGCTENFCIPLLEKVSGLKCNEGFFCGYSPERINPGDPKNNLTTVVKLTSGSNDKSSRFVDDLYKSIVKAGTFRAANIRTAEASKVLENVQRDVNIALINEVSNYFSTVGINTFDVLEAANTKWNFLDFRPGLVGGHCIGVDPYYLVSAAKKEGIHLQLINSARNVNEETIKRLAEDIVAIVDKSAEKCKSVLLMGCTFKENCTDTRNSASLKIARVLSEKNIVVDVLDPIVDWENLKDLEYISGKFQKLEEVNGAKYQASIILVAHGYFVANQQKIKERLMVDGGTLLDIKNILR